MKYYGQSICLWTIERQARTPTSPGKTLIDVTELAQNRYGFQVPVLLSQLAYQRCVAVASGQANQSETLWLFKVLALAKYAIRHCESGATSAGFKVQVNDHKLEPQLETLTAHGVSGCGIDCPSC